MIVFCSLSFGTRVETSTIFSTVVLVEDGYSLRELGMVAFVWFLFAWVDCFCLCLEVKVFLLCWLVAVRVQRHLAGGVTTF